MDKSRLLREFAARAAEESLDSTTLRLYLILLAGGRDSGHGIMTMEEIRTALGKNFSSSSLRAACRALLRMKLIELPASEPEPGADLTFWLLPPEEWRLKEE